MKKWTHVLILFVSSVLAACTVSPIEVSKGSGSTGGSSSSSSAGLVLPVSTPTNCLIIRSIDPATNSISTSSTTVTVELEYVIASNETTTHRFALIQIVEMTTPGFSVITTNLTLADRHGTAVLTLPLGNLWSFPGIKHPMTMRYSLCNFSDPTTIAELFVISNVTFAE